MWWFSLFAPLTARTWRFLLEEIKMEYSEQLKDPRWLVKRLSILIRDKFTCYICGYVTKKLHVHHRKYEGMAWEANDEDLVSLCAHCHRIVHRPDKADKKYENMKLSNIMKEVIS